MVFCNLVIFVKISTKIGATYELTGTAVTYNKLSCIFAKNLLLGRILALDYGAKRTGVAVTDDYRMIASGLTTVATASLLDFLGDYLQKETVDIIVVGEPKQMNNDPSESEALIGPFLEKLKQLFPEITVARQDERFTSKMAFQTLLDSGATKKQRRNKALVDEISATIILQDFLKHV
jgi:putative holliday junction resolvase